jgi:AbrB family looped-hinge helix DNA binding protein
MNFIEPSKKSCKTYYMTTTVSTKGQIVIPRSARQKLGIRPGDMLSTEVVRGPLVLRPVKKPQGKARIVISPATGLPAIDPPESAPEITSEQVKALLADFP